MNDTWLQWLLPVGLVVGLMLFKRLGQISSTEARRLVHEGAALVDVRSRSEFESGHLPGAINVPVTDVSAWASKAKKDRPVVVYCASGTRSAMARAALKRHGFANVSNLGAMARW